ncbi:MAG: MFS transporter [Bacillota bacterium]
MPQWKRNVIVLWISVFIAGICWTSIMPFFPVYLEQLGVNQGVEFWSGVIIALSSVCSMVMSPVWGAVGDRYGRRLMMLRAGIFLVLGYVLTAFAQAGWQLALIRMMIGALTGFVPMAVAIVGVSTPQAEVGQALGIIQTAWPSGAIIGPVVGGVALDLVGIRASSLTSAVLVGLATLLVLFAVREDFTPPPRTEQGILTDLRAAARNRLLMAVVLISAVSQAAIMALEPVIVPFVRDLAGVGAPGWIAGVLYALPGVAFVLMAPWWARRGERVGYAQTVALGLGLSALFYVPQAFVGQTWQLGALRLSSGVVGAAIGPGVAALLATKVPRDLRGRAFGLNQAASAAGAIVGPLLGGYVGSFVNPRGVFILIALIFFAGYVWAKRAVEPWVAAAEGVGEGVAEDAPTVAS